MSYSRGVGKVKAELSQEEGAKLLQAKKGHGLEGCRPALSPGSVSAQPDWRRLLPGLAVPRTWCYYEAGKSCPDAVAWPVSTSWVLTCLYVITGRRG